MRLVCPIFRFPADQKNILAGLVTVDQSVRLVAELVLATEVLKTAGIPRVKHHVLVE